MLIERLIKTILFEQRTVKWTIKPDNARKFALAQKAGAVYSFTMKLNIKRGKTADLTEKEIYTAISKFISQNAVVGKSSKYANGEYQYIISDNLTKSDQHLVFKVWILPSQDILSPRESQPEPGQDVVTISGRYEYRIGRSRLTSIDDIISRIKLSKSVSTVERDLIGKLININNKEAVDLSLEPIPADLQEPAIDDTEVINTTPEISVDEPIIYPYTYQSTIIYELDNKLYYTYNDQWQTVDKDKVEKVFRDSEAELPDSTVVTDQKIIDQLNTLYPDAIAKQAAVPTEEPSVVTPAVPAPKKKAKGTAVKFKTPSAKIPLYTYKNGSFIKSTTPGKTAYIPANNPTACKYMGISTTKEYTDLLFPNGSRFWVKTDTLK
jgi:hypothetical protein